MSDWAAMLATVVGLLIGVWLFIVWSDWMDNR